ncbi:hypothetical protein Tsubulata_025997 [Turnera subulata]|uniref:DUF1639 family protein n=1 Tax=Turnera subulata TaxID=218843 RepID=A0A9Q0J8X8_9ROSI|nr:hypothetical protein Tsubulata_025997 [Turnera subulata]
MATTAPMKVKPHQLHNFPVSLKWGQTTTLSAANSSSPATAAGSPAAAAADSETESEPEPRTRSRSARHQRFSFALLKNSPPKAPAFEPNPPPQSQEREHHRQPPAEKEENNNGGNNFRPWKLRPRKEPVAVASHEQQREKEKEKEGQFHQQQPPKSARLRGMVEGSSNGVGGGGGVGEREGGVCVEKKRKFWIALSKEEIEEDVFIMTGSRPARRPKKRPKNVQKVLDGVFPGLWLVGATVDSYRIAEPPVKG